MNPFDGEEASALADFTEQLGLVRGDDGCWRCPKCSSLHGNDWRQCNGACPVVISPYYRQDGPHDEDKPQPHLTPHRSGDEGAA